MKNKLIIDIDTERKEPGTVIIGKMKSDEPLTNEQAKEMWMDDMGCVCEALVTMIRLGEDEGWCKGADSLRVCMVHIQEGFADPDYQTKRKET
jgi:hypothetical protein